jgi:nicotinate dehydrogenase subunit A
MPAVTLHVNGEQHSVDLPESTPLLFVLRNDLKLKGAKLGCGTGHCGACTVLVGGNPANACTTPLWSIGSSEVTTVEGCGNDAVRQAFEAHQAAQCGYCIPGIMMTARGLLAKDPAIPRDHIVEVLAERHLCRCGAHVRILDAIESSRPRA